MLEYFATNTREKKETNQQTQTYSSTEICAQDTYTQKGLFSDELEKNTDHRKKYEK